MPNPGLTIRSFKILYIYRIQGRISGKANGVVVSGPPGLEVL